MRDPARRLAPLLPFLLFALLAAGTWKRWIFPFQDSGREAMTAARVAAGERLYVDVTCAYGPVPILLDGAVVRACGRNLDALTAWRTLLALAGLEALRRLLVRLTGSGTAAAAGAALVVATCFFGGAGGCYLFPYSVAVLLGSVATWWALEIALGGASFPSALGAGVLAGIAAGSKLEFLPAAIAGVGVALGLVRPRRQWVAGTALAALLGVSAYAIPIARYGADAIARSSFLIARQVPEPWRLLYVDLFWGGGTASTFPGRFLEETLLPSAAVLGVALLAARRLRAPGPAFGAALLLAGVAGGLAFRSGAVALLVPASVAAWLAAGGLSLASRRIPSDPRVRALLACGAAMLPLAARQPFSMVPLPYTSFTAPLALATGFALLVRLAASRPALLLVVLGVAAARGGQQIAQAHVSPVREVRFPAGSFLLQTDEAKLLEDAVHALVTRTPPGSYAAVFPESGMVLFLADRRNPFRDDLFLPGTQDGDEEREMIARLERLRPAAAIVVDRSTAEFGYRGFGIDYLREFRMALEGRMAPAERLGDPDPARAAPYPARASHGVLLLPRPG